MKITLNLCLKSHENDRGRQNTLLYALEKCKFCAVLSVLQVLILQDFNLPQTAKALNWVKAFRAV